MVKNIDENDIFIAKIVNLTPKSEIQTRKIRKFGILTSPFDINTG